MLIKLLYLVIVVRVSSKRRVRPGLAITNALNTITSPITISYRKASSSSKIQYKLRELVI